MIRTSQEMPEWRSVEQVSLMSAHAIHSPGQPIVLMRLSMKKGLHPQQAATAPVQAVFGHGNLPTPMPLAIPTRGNQWEKERALRYQEALFPVTRPCGQNLNGNPRVCADTWRMSSFHIALFRGGFLQVLIILHAHSRTGMVNAGNETHGRKTP